MCQIYERKLKRELAVRTMTMLHQPKFGKLGTRTVSVTESWKQSLRHSFVNVKGSKQ